MNILFLVLALTRIEVLFDANCEPEEYGITSIVGDTHFLLDVGSYDELDEGLQLTKRAILSAEKRGVEMKMEYIERKIMACQPQGIIRELP